MAPDARRNFNAIAIANALMPFAGKGGPVRLPDFVAGAYMLSTSFMPMFARTTWLQGGAGIAL